MSGIRQKRRNTIASDLRRHHDLDEEMKEKAYVRRETFLEPVKSDPLVLLALTRSQSEGRRLRTALTRGRSDEEKKEFAMRSTKPGSDLWENMMRPFVSNLAFRCLTRRRSESEVCFKPYSCHAAVLFVDISGYSRVAATISHRGAFVLSSIVNAYLDRLLKIAQQYGGDVVKFAGDAVLIVWEGEERDLCNNTHCAARCALEMQELAGSHPVDGTNLTFRIHCGLSCGAIDSEIFVAPAHVNMQRLYHAVGGEPLREISKLVDLAAPGEVVVSGDCVDHLGDRGVYAEVSGSSDAKILKHLSMERSIRDLRNNEIEKEIQNRLLRRDLEIEEDFVHPSVLRQLLLGGLTPTQICQMRNLCVLFIGKTSKGNAVNWLREVHGVLDKHRCPIVQIIEDDKGVHVVAAVNLHESVLESSILALEACRELVKKQVGCAIGMAMGTAWCGVIGSYSVGCRWDIVGPPAVRAARLMQYALLHDIEVVIDDSVHQDKAASPRMKCLNAGIRLKGSPEAVPIYTLSDSTNFSAFMMLESFQFAAVYDEIVAKIEARILSSKNRGAVMVTGPPLAGKKVVCQRAAGRASLCPVLHVCDESAGLLQLARTIATWFRRFENDKVRELADSTIDHLENQRWCKAHDECVSLVNTVILEGLHGCFVVDRVQAMDDFSISLVRESLMPTMDSIADGSGEESGSGKIFFLLVHVPLYHLRMAECIVNDIVRCRKIDVPTFEVVQASLEEIKSFPREVMDMKINGRWVHLLAETSGRCIGYLNAQILAVRNTSGAISRQEKSDVTKRYSLHIPARIGRRTLNNINVMQVDAAIAMRFLQVFDELPPRFQTLVKVLNLATRPCWFKVPHQVVWEVLNRLIEEKVELSTLFDMLGELQAMHLIKVEEEDDRCSLLCPAFGDTVMELCTPFQIQSICRALIHELKLLRSRDFKLPLVLASLHGRLGTNQKVQRRLWRRSYNLLLENLEEDISGLKEIIEEEIEEAGLSAQEVLGDSAIVSTASRSHTVHHNFFLLTIFAAPIAFGQMGHTLSVIARGVCIQMREFHERPVKDILKVQRDIKSAVCRYKSEVDFLEQYLEVHGCGLTADEKDDELRLLNFTVQPTLRREHIEIQVEQMLDHYIPTYVDARRTRLHQLMKKLRQDGIPDIVENAPEAIRRAYQYLVTTNDDRHEAAQNALIVLATSNLKPKLLEEELPVMFYQTVVRIRDLILQRHCPGKFTIHGHEESIDDLEAFLVVTALFHSRQQRQS